jgi:hypothetical protein
MPEAKGDPAAAPGAGFDSATRIAAAGPGTGNALPREVKTLQEVPSPSSLCVSAPKIRLDFRSNAGYHSLEMIVSIGR